MIKDYWKKKLKPFNELYISNMSYYNYRWKKLDQEGCLCSAWIFDANKSIPLPLYHNMPGTVHTISSIVHIIEESLQQKFIKV